MAFNSIGSTASSNSSGLASTSERLSQSGQMIGWGVYGTLVVIGFAFGIVTGYDRPKTITVTKVAKESDSPKPETPKPETPKPDNSKSDPKPTPTPEPTVPTAPMQPITTAPMETSSPKPMVTTPPKADPKPPMPTVTTPPKVDPPKKEDPVAAVKPVSFTKDVKPILLQYCFNCHGSVGKPKDGIDLRTLASIKKGGDGGSILTPGSPEKSSLYTTIVDGSMPKGPNKVPKSDQMIIFNWIKGGAKERRRFSGARCKKKRESI